MQHGSPHRWFDAAAVGASAVCLVHCLGLPLLIAALPALAGVLDLGEGVHQAILAFALPVSVVALVGGHRRHRHAFPPLGGAFGLALLACALFAEKPGAELAITLAGSLLLASAHLANWRLRTSAT